MRARFLIEVDGSGAIVSREEGDLGTIPESLLSVAGRLVSAGVFQVSFLWVPEGKGKPCAVTVGYPRGSKLEGAAAYVGGQWLEKIPFGLTAREIDVLTLLVLGLSSAAIAEQLTLSTRTVTTHVDHVMRKLGVLSRTAAATLALDEGLLRVPFPGRPESSDLLRIGRALRERSAPEESSRRMLRRSLVIGAALPLSGSAAADGIEMMQAGQLAVDELNERGGIDGRSIELAVVDVDIFDGDRVRAALEELVGKDVDVVTSGYLAHQDVAHEFMADSGVPYLHAATLNVMAQRVSEDPGRYGGIFQVCANDSNYAPRFVEMMSQLRGRRQWRPSSKRLVVVQAAWDQTDLGLDEASVLAERDDWELEFLQPEADRSDTWVELADRIRAREPAAVMIGNYLVEDTVTFLNSFLDRPSETLIYSLYAPSVPEFREIMGPRADGLLWATVTGTYSDPRARAFAARYRERFGLNPGRSHAGIAYDRVRLVAHAWAYSQNPRDPRKVAEELRQLTYRGVNGVYYFGDPTQTALTYPGRTADPSLAQAHLVFQIQDGRQRIIDPAPYADAEFVVPPWLRQGVRELGAVPRT